MPIFLLLFLMFMLVSLSRGDLVDFHFGGLDQTGPAVVGGAGDTWNHTTLTNGGPVTLKDTTGQATGIALSWTSCDAWGATKTISYNTTSTSMDANTAWLMRSCIASYQYTTGFTNLTLTLTGLKPSQSYSLVLIGSGYQIKEGTKFTVTGTGTFTGSTTGLNRKLSAGAGDAYITLQVVSSSEGTLKVNTLQNGQHYAIINGFQLQSNSTQIVTSTPPVVTPPTVTPPTSTPPSTTDGSTTTPTKAIAWGICGHPTWTDYSNYIPANAATQVSYLNQLGCKYYRCSFEGANYASILDLVVPKSQAAGITVLPILPLTLKPANTAETTYNLNYQTAYTWATYAISKNYALTYWELGNELENWGSLVTVVGDGTSVNDFPDKTPGGFVAIASGLQGAYQGIHDAYAAGRASGATTIDPQVLFGACYRHWGLLTKIQNYNGSLPFDMLSWHWYGPSYGDFNNVINNTASPSNGRTPVQCLADFKKHSDPSQPMDIWITETNRSVQDSKGYFNGSVATDATSSSAQDWAAEGNEITVLVDSFKNVPTVKGIFIYELFDTTKAYEDNASALKSDGYMGVITGLNGTLKNGFYSYQAEIQANQ